MFKTYVYNVEHMYEMIFGKLHMYCRRLIAYNAIHMYVNMFYKQRLNAREISTYVKRYLNLFFIILHMFAKHILHEICTLIFVHMSARAGPCLNMYALEWQENICFNICQYICQYICLAPKPEQDI